MAQLDHQGETIVNQDEKRKETVLNVEEVVRQLDELWKQANSILTSETDEIDNSERAKKLSEAVHKITDILIEASTQSELVNVACEFCLKNDIYIKVYRWTGEHRGCLKLMAYQQLKYFNSLLELADISLLMLKAVLIPLMLLLLSLKPTDKRKIPPDISLLYVKILYYISKRISNNDFLDLLAADIYTDEGFRIPKFTFFELLILYTHYTGEVGQHTRESILSCFKVSNHHVDFEQYISQQSAGCVVSEHCYNYILSNPMQ